MATKLIFCGSRDWTDDGLIVSVMSAIKENIGEFVVIEGENGEKDRNGRVVRGADLMSRSIAEEIVGLQVEPYPANWTKFGRAAGPIRNTQMRMEGKADGVVAFHNDLQHSKGTKNMVEQALKAGLPVCHITGHFGNLEEFILNLKGRLRT